MRMRALLRRWDHWALRQAPPHILAIVRIALGLFLLLYWGLHLPDVALLYSRDGLVLPLYQDLPAALQFLLAPPSAGVALALYALFLVCLLCVTCGIALRTAGLIAVLFNTYYWYLSLYLFGSSYDRLFLFLLLVIALSGADRAYSLRMRLRTGKWDAWEPASVLPQRLIALQIAATYLGVGLQKLILPAWQSGEILPYSMIGAWATPLGLWLVRLNLPITVYDVLVEAIIFFECLLPFGLWWKPTRTWFVLGGALFHILITLLLGIWWFLILIPAYIVFWEPETLPCHGEPVAP